MNRLVIAGTSSGVGKTTISIGIMGALCKKGKRVAPFKIGPDYIDTQFHKFVTNNPSYNLDSWLLNEDTIKYLFNKNTTNMDIAIIEGVMGLYDGFGTKKDEGSTAHLAKILKAPVILVIDGEKLSTSAAATVLGYKIFDEDVNIQAIIVNKVSGEEHYKLIKESIESYVKIPCVGYLPSNLHIPLKSRHLGLVPAGEINNLRENVDKITELISKFVDIDKIQQIASKVSNIEEIKNKYIEYKNLYKGINIGYAYDKAFNFYYEDNLNLMKYMGVNVIHFSPLNDSDIPNVDGLYIGGGFPEVFSVDLEKNTILRNNIKNKLENYLPCYCECGGLMYLTQSIENISGEVNKMVGFFPNKTKMTNKLQRFGYVEITTESKILTKGHEFHKSIVEHNTKTNYHYNVYKNKYGQVISRWNCGLIKKDVLAGYPHIHFYSNPLFLVEFLNKCREYKKRNTSNM